MRTLTVGLAIVAFLALASGLSSAPQQQELGILKFLPGDSARADAELLVIFDRPVAGFESRVVDPATLLTIDPSVPGKADWRDPITLRFTPDTLLDAGTNYTITVNNSFAALDGTRLARPWQKSFRTAKPRLIAVVPRLTHELQDGVLRANVRILGAYSAPVRMSELPPIAKVTTGTGCGATRTVLLRAAGQRPVHESEVGEIAQQLDMTTFEWRRTNDSLARIVEFDAAEQLPPNCYAVAHLPIAPGSDVEGTRSFSSYGDFKVDSVSCNSPRCTHGPLTVFFSTPVNREAVMRHVRVTAGEPMSLAGSAASATSWTLSTTYQPRQEYRVAIDAEIKDEFGQTLTGERDFSFRMEAVAPAASLTATHLLATRTARALLPIRHVNTPSVTLDVIPVPQDELMRALTQAVYLADSLPRRLWSTRTRIRFAVSGPPDAQVDTIVPLLTQLQQIAPGNTAFLISVHPSSSEAEERNVGFSRDSHRFSLVRLTDLALQTRLDASQGWVWVTGVRDGKSVAGAQITAYGLDMIPVGTATTNEDGLARIEFSAATVEGRLTASASAANQQRIFFLRASHGGDTLVSTIPNNSAFAPRAVSPSISREGMPSAGLNSAVASAITDRGIYRPGEKVKAIAFLRRGPLGATRFPGAADSVRWIVASGRGAATIDATLEPLDGGLSALTVPIPTNAPLGNYTARVQMRHLGQWADVARVGFAVAEYRAPEFLVDLRQPDSTLLVGDTVKAMIAARYLFDAPVAGGQLAFSSTVIPNPTYTPQVPGLEGYEKGWHGLNSVRPTASTQQPGNALLDADGKAEFDVVVPQTFVTPARVTIQAAVSEEGRQPVTREVSVVALPANIVIGAKPETPGFVWRSGEQQRIGIRTVDLDGSNVSGVRVQGTLIAWRNRAESQSAGLTSSFSYQPDTVGSCQVTTGVTDVFCSFTAAGDGYHEVVLTAPDLSNARRIATTAFVRWSMSQVPSEARARYGVTLISDKREYEVGDTAIVTFDVTLDSAEAWLTVEREQVLEQRRFSVRRGRNTVAVPVRAEFLPNAFVSLALVEAVPFGIVHPQRPALRVGYVGFRVDASHKQLRVGVVPQGREFEAGDSASIAISVRGANGGAAPATVALWAVDNAVLALTEYQTPDLFAAMYAERGTAMSFGSTLPLLAASIAEIDASGIQLRSPSLFESELSYSAFAGGGGRGGAGGFATNQPSVSVRSEFSTTPIFLEAVRIGASGDSVLRVKLPDNLTTFRVMALAFSGEDKYGSGESDLVVTRPIVARPALPRFVRVDDSLRVAVLVNDRSGVGGAVSVSADVTGVTIRTRSAREQLGGGEARLIGFWGRVLNEDSTVFRFNVAGERGSDAVRVALPVRPDFEPRRHTYAGVLRDSSSVVFQLPANIDVDRSRLVFGVGVSVVQPIRWAHDMILRDGSMDSECVLSEGLATLAMLRVTQMSPGEEALLRAELQSTVAVLSSRVDAGIGVPYWPRGDFSTVDLTSRAALFLLDAQRFGVDVNPQVISNLEFYLRNFVRRELPPAPRLERVDFDRAWMVQEPEPGTPSDLGNRVRAFAFLSQRPAFGNLRTQFDTLRMRASELYWEDRLRLAETLFMLGDGASANRLLAEAWASVRILGNRAEIPDSVITRSMGLSRVRAAARLLSATHRIEPNNSRLGALVESLVRVGQAERGIAWGTSDFAEAAVALSQIAAEQSVSARREITVSSRGRVVATISPEATSSDSGISLRGLLRSSGGGQELSLLLKSDGDVASYYSASVVEIPRTRPTTPDAEGLVVERWYETLDGRAVTQVEVGDFVHVRLRVTAPADRPFVVLKDLLPAGLEAIDTQLKTTSALGPFMARQQRPDNPALQTAPFAQPILFGKFSNGWWSPWEHTELFDDHVTFFARFLWAGTYTAGYVARATTAGVFVVPPAQAEEMYNPALRGRNGGSTFTVRAK